MTDNVKRSALTFLLIAAIVLVLIAAALPQLELKPGIPLPGVTGDSQAPKPELSVPLVAISISMFLKALFGIIIGLVVVYSLYQMIRGTPWKELLGPSLMIILVVTVIVCILFGLIHAQITLKSEAPEIIPPAAVVKGPPLGALPPFLIWLTWIAAGVTILLLALWLIFWKAVPNRRGDLLELEAQRGLQALRSGRDLKTVIVECYRQMSQALQKEQGIELEQSMTAREFERSAEVKGIPYEPVHQLTQLFEMARYGYRAPGPEDERKALDCLQAIVQYSQTKRQSD